MLDRYRELTAKVDAFFARVEARHGADLSCAVGCTMCCHTRLTVTGIEAAVLRQAIAAMSDQARAALVDNARQPVDPDEPRCAALAADGRCLVYEARPLVCRSHGVPIRTGRRSSLPVITACEKNFTAHGPDAADADCILDQETLSTVLLALDTAHAQATERTPGARVELAALLIEAATTAPDD
jgi:Fe-S-cluster containining protein